MATIQIREIPEEAYEILRRRARTAGQSIQAYMRDQVVGLASRPTTDEAWHTVEAALYAENSPGSTREGIVRDLREDRDGKHD